MRVAVGYWQLHLGGADDFAVRIVEPPTDVVAWHFAGEAGGQGIIRRNVDPSTGMLLPSLDFGGPEAFAFDQRRLSVPDWELTSVRVQFRTLNGTIATLACYDDPYREAGCVRPKPDVVVPGVPEPGEGEAHRLWVWGSDRWSMTCSRYAADQVPVLPAPLGNVSVAPVTESPDRRFHVRYSRDSEYNAGVRMEFSNGRNLAQERQLHLYLSDDYLREVAAIDFVTPGFGRIEGWTPVWGLLPTSPITFRFVAQGWSPVEASGDAPCREVDHPDAVFAPQAAQVRAAWVDRTLPF